MSNKFTIDIGPDGFVAPGEKNPNFKVKKSQKVVFNLVNGAQPVDVYFSSGSPFGINPVPVSSSGSGELTLQAGTEDQSFPMEATTTTEEGSTETLRDGMKGDIDVTPG